MTLQILFQKLGSSYDDILCRLVSEERIIKFLKMFLQDDSYAQLKESLQNNDIVNSFIYAHNIKGICQNLNFPLLASSSSELTEQLRKENVRNFSMNDFLKTFEKVTIDYNNTINYIKEFFGE